MEEFLNKVFVKVDVKDDNIRFIREDGKIFGMRHEQDCCESVYIESINGDLEDLVGVPMLIAEESCNSNEDEFDEDGNVIEPDEYRDESFTWTFYRFATIKGYVDIRWYGCSNGYYSESVDIYDDGTDISYVRDYLINKIDENL